MSSSKNDAKYLKHYFQYLKQHKGLLLFGFVLIPLITFFHLLQPYLLKRAIDDAILQSNMDLLKTIAIFYGLCLLLDFSCKSLQSYLFQYIGQKTVTAIRYDLFKHVLNFSSSYYDKTPVGVVSTRLTSDIESLNDSFASGLVTLLVDLLTLIGIIIAMFLLSPKLTLVTILILPPMAVLVNFFRIKLRYYYNQIRSTIGQMNGYIQEQFQGAAILQLFKQQQASMDHYDTINKTYRQVTIGSVTYDALLYSIIEALNSILIALVIWYGWGQYQGSVITLGLLVAFIEYIHKFFTPLKEISTKFAILQHTLAALEKIFGTFATQDSLPSGSHSQPDIEGRIRFDSVSFSYPTHTDKQILNGVSFDIKPGEVVAVVGPTGSGKTTVLRLLSRLYDGYEGSIFVDDTELRNWDTQTIRSQIAIVTQEVTIVSDTVGFNVSLGNPAINQERIEWACKLVGIHPAIMELENGYDTELNTGKSSLSQGQAQLLSFARALASPAPLLLLDEATASVDSLSESEIQLALESLFKEKTTIVVAHRLSTIQKADLILALKGGEIIESGTHDALIAKKGFYANLFEMQF